MLLYKGHQNFSILDWLAVYVRNSIRQESTGQAAWLLPVGKDMEAGWGDSANRLRQATLLQRLALIERRYNWQGQRAADNSLAAGGEIGL